jgi:hypothetical protein
MQPDVRQLEALARIKVQEPDFVDWLERRLKEHLAAMRRQRDDVDVRWAQGRTQEIEEILSFVNDAQNFLAKASQPASNRKSGR